MLITNLSHVLSCSKDFLFRFVKPLRTFFNVKHLSQRRLTITKKKMRLRVKAVSECEAEGKLSMTRDCDILLNECRNRQSVVSKGGSVHEPDECFLPKCNFNMYMCKT